MRWLIDGYNVIRRDPELAAREAESLEAGRRALLHLVARRAAELSDEFTVVFDGARPGGAAPSGGRVRTLFSRPPETADDLIGRLARQWGAGVVVVSSDRAVQGRARRAGSPVLSAEEFLAPEPGEGNEDDESPPAAKRGNPRRRSRQERAAARARRRLGGP